MRKAARTLTAAAIAAGLLVPAAAASAAQPTGPLATEDAPPSGTEAGDGASGSITYGLGAASGGKPDGRGFLQLSVTPGATVYDNVVVVNASQLPLSLDLYTADATNGDDGSLVGSLKADAPQLAGAWITLGSPSVDVPPQKSGEGPGMVIVPVTITVPRDAEPGDHMGYVFTSLTAAGQSGDEPALNLEQRVGLRVYVSVEGQVRAGLTVTNVHARFVASSGSSTPSLEVEYTLTNTGNIRYGVNPSVRATGPFGLAPHTVDAQPIEMLLPHSSVKQTVTLPGVTPLFVENVTVSATAVVAPGAEDPGIGTVRASTWTWVWSWWYLAVLTVILAGAGWWQARRRRRRPGTWGPPEALWQHERTPPSGGPKPEASPTGAGPDKSPERIR